MVCEGVRVWAHICTYMRLEDRGQCMCFPQSISNLLRQILSWKLEVTNLWKLAGQ